MAEVVLGIGTSHGPMLNTNPENWGARAEADRGMNLYFRGNQYSFDELVAERAGENLESQLGESVWRERHAVCSSAVADLAEDFARTQPDVAVIISDDHKEIFDDENMPSVLVYTGSDVDHVPFTEEQLAAMPPGLAQAEVRNQPDVPTKQPCAPDLANHLVDDVIGAGTPVSVSAQLPPGSHGTRSIPHGYGFVYRHIMKDRVVPNVPIFVNAFYPPNQPTAATCYEFGSQLAEAIASWPESKRVAIVASGGLSHFVIDEEFDRHVLSSLGSADSGALRSLRPDFLQSGTAEIRNWVALAGAMDHFGLSMTLKNYVPCYRSEAGTGNAMGFATWM